MRFILYKKGLNEVSNDGTEKINLKNKKNKIKCMILCNGNFVKAKNGFNVIDLMNRAEIFYLD